MPINPRDLAHYALPPADWRPPWSFLPAGPEQLALIAEIEVDFDGVELGDGMTWLQGEALDNRESPELIAAVGRIDRFDRWQDVPDGLIAEYPCASGFLDDAGRRFYLPVAMRFELRYRGRPGAVVDNLFVDPGMPRMFQPWPLPALDVLQLNTYMHFTAWYFPTRADE